MQAMNTIRTGELSGVTTATQLPNISCGMVKFKASVGNAGNVYLGGSGVTKPNGNTDTTTGFELAPGDESGWIPVSNLSHFYRICDTETDDLLYLIVM